MDLLAQTYGVRDLAISSLGIFGRSPRTVKAAMVLRIAMDLGDAALLSTRVGPGQVRTKVLAVTLGWAGPQHARAAGGLAAQRLTGDRAGVPAVGHREAGRGAVGPHHQRGPTRAGAQPVGGVADPARRPRSRRCRPRSGMTPPR